MQEQPVLVDQVGRTRAWTTRALPCTSMAEPGSDRSRPTSSSIPPPTTRVPGQPGSPSVVENTSLASSFRARMMRGSSLPPAGSRLSPAS